MKLRKLHIEDYKMFKDFDISFVDENDEPLPIVVLAGVNGSGKTSLLKFMKDFVTTGYFDINGQLLEVSYDGNIYNVVSANDSTNPVLYEYNFVSDNIVYLPAGADKIENIKETIIQKYIDRAFEIDKPSEALKELQLYIKSIFDSLELSFNLSDVKYNEKEVLFQDNSGNEFDIDELSTGEKTLLSKILYLFFQGYEEKVILIDEPELSLHPSWQNKILKIYENFAKQNNCQIIIATHSPHIIGSAKNEYLRILRKNEDGNIEVVEDLKAEGRDINSILFDVMGEVAYRPREFDDKIDRLHIAIDDKKIEEAKERLEELKKSYGENDEVVMEAQMLIDMFSRDAE